MAAIVAKGLRRCTQREIKLDTENTLEDAAELYITRIL